MTPAPEFSRPQRLDTIGAGPSEASIAADAAERAALATRFDIVAIDALVADYTLHRDAGGIRAGGHLSATVTQTCVATGAPVPARIEEDFRLRFLPEPGDGPEDGEEAELDADDCDTVFYSGGVIDLGEAAAETLALALDPFPRAADAPRVLKAAGVLGEEEIRPPGAFAGLKDRLAGG